jgi:Fe-Mn family superoxide dismutase
MSKHAMKRREFIRNGALLTVGGLVMSKMGGAISLTDGRTIFTLPPLPYATDALEPYIDKLTMEIHYGKHHQAYVTNLNKALAEDNATNYKTIEELCKSVHPTKTAIRNNGGGHYNHSLFWKLMKPPVKLVSKDVPPTTTKEVATTPSGPLVDAIVAHYGSMETFKTQFLDKAKSVFGSGWCWLVVNDVNKLEIGTTPNQDNPLMSFTNLKGVPVLALDVWEHAYYLKHQNLRMDYVNDWWALINWEEAGKLFDGAKGAK